MYETLLDEAHKERVEVVSLSLAGNIKGLYHDNVIAINSNLQTTAEKACILAEELGHYHTSVGDILDQSMLMNRKQEQRARRWGYERMVPLNKLLAAYRAGVYSPIDLADHLNITPRYLQAAIQHYLQKYGSRCCVDGVWVYFNPFRIYEVHG